MLEAIVQNPFRVLGVYSNSRQADIVRNIGRMKAYLNVGKAIEFESDMSAVLPPISRTLASSQNAQAAITLPIDKIRHALFWFCKVDPIDDAGLNNLASGDTEKALSIFSKKESFSTLLNQAVLSMIVCDYTKAVGFYSTLIHSFTFRDQLCNAICGDTFQITEEELSHFVIDELLHEIKAVTLLGLVRDDNDKSYLKEAAIKEPLSIINGEIAKAKNSSANDATSFLKAGKTLMQNTRAALATLRLIVGVDDMQYQSAVDNLAKQVLQCGINYFNKSEDNNAVDNALEIQQYALSIACGKLTKDRCKQNVDILHKRKQQAAYEGDIKAIAEELQSFKDAYSSISRARQLLDNCEPHLSVLKSNLGSSDNTYLQISSAVANNALSMVIDVINKDTSSRSNSKAAQEVITRISAMDLDSQTRSRVTQNASIIARNIAVMPTGFEKVDNATGGCLGSILGYLIWFGVIALIGGIISLFS